MMNAKKVWLVTGASKGLGLTLVKALLSNGAKVAATSRDVKGLEKAVETSENFLPLEVDLLNETTVKKMLDATLSKFGAIDVVVNNAGYGQLGTIEELTDAEARANFDVNVFGSLNIIRNVMPHFRARKTGRIFTISSIAGFLGTFPGWGIYNATKFAVAGFTEAFSAEVKSMGVRATIVYPGYFRTEFLSKESLSLADNPIADYAEARELDRVHQHDIPGNQPGNPDKAAEAFIQLAEMENPPLHFFMGSDSLAMAQSKIEFLQKELTSNVALSKSTDF